MADFSTPFASSGDLRNPTTDEKQTGFACGPLDRALFNRLFNRMESELGAIVDEAGVTPSESDDTTVLQAIQALIEAATGGGDTSAYATMAQLRARLPIFPEVLTSDGKMGIITPTTGQVRIPAGVTFLHRGVYTVTTTQTDFSTSLSKTYHLRWNSTSGFALKDLSDTAVYNPSALAETHSNFDSTYDDMLIARVVTNSSNVPTITNLINLSSLKKTADYRLTLSGALNWTTRNTSSTALEWARTPVIANVMLNEYRVFNSGPSDGVVTGTQYGVQRNLGFRIPSYSRYSIPNLEYYFEDDKAGTATADGLASVTVTAMAV